MAVIGLTDEERRCAREWRDMKRKTDPDNVFTHALNEMFPEDFGLTREQTPCIYCSTKNEHLSNEHHFICIKCSKINRINQGVKVKQ